MKQNLDTHLGDREEEQNPPSNIPPVPLPRDTSEGELDIFSGKSPVLAERKKLEPEDEPGQEAFTLESPPSNTEQENCAQRRIKGMNLYIDEQYERYIARKGEKTIASKMSIIYAKCRGNHTEGESFPSNKLYHTFYDGEPPIPNVEVSNNNKFANNPLTIARKGQKPWVNMKVEARGSVESEYAYDFKLKQDNAVCILFLTEEGETAKLKNDAEYLRHENIPFILVGVKPVKPELEGMAVAKELGAALYMEWDQNGDVENLRRLFKQVAIISNMSKEERELYRQAYWAELEYQDFIKENGVAALVKNLKDYIEGYSNNPAEKVRDVLVSSILFQGASAAKKEKHKTENNKKNAAGKLIAKLEFDQACLSEEQNNLDGDKKEPNFTIADIDALVEGTLGNTVKGNLPVYNMLGTIRAKLVNDANPTGKKEVSRSHSVQSDSERRREMPLPTLEAADNGKQEKEDDQYSRKMFLMEGGWRSNKVDDPLFEQAFNKWKMQKQYDDAEKNYQEFIKTEDPRRASGQSYRLAGALEGYIASCNSKPAQQNRGSLISSTLFQYFTVPEQSTDDTNKNAARQLKDKLVLDQNNIIQPPRKFVTAPQLQLSIQDLEALCNDKGPLEPIISGYPAVRALLEAMRNKELNQSQQTQSAQPPEGSSFLGRFSRKG